MAGAAAALQNRGEPAATEQLLVYRGLLLPHFCCTTWATPLSPH
jgi:hypothetical protein